MRICGHKETIDNLHNAGVEPDLLERGPSSPTGEGKQREVPIRLLKAKLLAHFVHPKYGVSLEENFKNWGFSREN